MKKNVVTILGICSLFILCCLFNGSISSRNLESNKIVDQIVYDHMGEPYRDDNPNYNIWGKHEGNLPISNSFDWCKGARPKDWMNYGVNKALSSWGQIFEDKDGSPVKNVRFQMRNHFMYIYSDNKWILAENVSKNIEAKYFLEQNFNDTGETLKNHSETFNGGGVSYDYDHGKLIHWWKKQWPVERYKLPTDFEAIFISCEIRLIQSNVTDKGVDLDEAKFYAGVGADYYLNTNSVSQNNNGLSMSRHKRITSQWKTFTAYIAGESIPKSIFEYKNQILSRPLPPIY